MNSNTGQETDGEQGVQVVATGGGAGQSMVENPLFSLPVSLARGVSPEEFAGFGGELDVARHDEIANEIPEIHANESTGIPRHGSVEAEKNTAEADVDGGMPRGRSGGQDIPAGLHLVSSLPPHSSHSAISLVLALGTS
jgi:hypothetical protein